MGSVSQLTNIVRRRSSGKVMGHHFEVSLLPGDSLEIRPAYARNPFSISLHTLLAVMSNLVAKIPLPRDKTIKRGAPEEALSLDRLCAEAGFQVVVGSLLFDPTGSWTPAFALGSPTTTAAGVQHSRLTPWFENVDSLAAHCVDHYSDLASMRPTR